MLYFKRDREQTVNLSDTDVCPCPSHFLIPEKQPGQLFCSVCYSNTGVKVTISQSATVTFTFTQISSSGFQGPTFSTLNL